MKTQAFLGRSHQSGRWVTGPQTSPETYWLGWPTKQSTIGWCFCVASYYPELLIDHAAKIYPTAVIWKESSVFKVTFETEQAYQLIKQDLVKVGALAMLVKESSGHRR